MDLRKEMNGMRFGILFSLLTLLYGFGLGGAFGAAEDQIKGHLKNSAKAVLDTVYKKDSSEMKKVTDKSWSYFKRAHLHANGLGTTALALIYLLAFLNYSPKLKSLTALALGVGSLLYSAFWMFAGLKAPGMGSTGAAKASLEFMAIPGSGLCILGLVSVLVGTLYTFFLSPKSTN